MSPSFLFEGHHIQMSFGSLLFFTSENILDTPICWFGIVFFIHFYSCIILFIEWRCHSFFNHSLVYGHLNDFLYFAFINNVPLKNTVHMLFVWLEVCLPKNFLETGLLDQKISACITLLDIPKFSWGAFNTYQCLSPTPKRF